MINSDSLLKAVVQSLVFSGVGLAVFLAGFFVVKAIVPFDLRKEIEVDHNVSVGILLGSFIIGLSIIIAAAVHGG